MSDIATANTYESGSGAYEKKEKEPVAPVQTMLLAFKGDEISRGTFSHVIDCAFQEVPKSKVALDLSSETKHYRHLLELNLLNRNDPDLHFLVARKVGDGPWLTNQVDRPEDFRGDIEKVLEAERLLPPQPGTSNFSAFGVDGKFLQEQWDSGIKK